MDLLEIHMLGGFRVSRDGVDLPDGTLPRRAADLVKLLALAPGHSLHRERAVEAIWPTLEREAAFANLHKAAHLARRAIGDPSAVVLRRGEVLLAPDARVQTDVERFEATRDPDLYAGELLPEDRYEPWASEPRTLLRHAYGESLRVAGRWRELAEEDPADEEAQRALMEAEAASHRRHAALERFHRLSEALAPAGLAPTAETVALYDSIARGPAAVAPLAATRPLVDRERELEAARATWRRAGAGRGGALVVAGEAGVGKTRLCEELLAEAAAAGWTTLRGAAREEEGAAPYAPVAEALDRLLLERPDLAGRLTEGARAELARFSVAFPGAPAPAARRPDRQRIFAAVGQLLAAAARERGAVLLVEDVHAADEASVQLLHALARAARFQRLLLVLAFRDEAVAPALAQARASLLEQRVADQIRLEPLEREASVDVVRQVAPAPPGGETEEAIWRLAGGNAFFTEELAAAVRPDGSLDVPLRLYEVQHARLGRLQEPARAALARLSVLGGSFTADELASLGRLGEEEAFAVLDQALAAGVVRPQGTRYGFRHGLVREALVRVLPPHRRAAAHREAAELL
ncbi:MAG: ATP-binding protein, partial [Gaiellaceae bacterium]